MQSHDSAGLIGAIVNHAAADFLVVLIHDLNDFAAKEVSDHSFNTDRQQALAFADSLDGTLIKKGDLYGIDLGGDVIPLPKEKTADGKLDAYVGKKIKMGIRPEDIDDEPEFMAKHTDCQLDAQVDVSEMMGAEIYLYLEYKGNKMTARVAPTSKARNGDTVRVAFDPHKVHVFDVETEQTILN